MCTALLKPHIQAASTACARSLSRRPVLRLAYTGIESVGLKKGHPEFVDSRITLNVLRTALKTTGAEIQIGDGGRKRDARSSC